MREPRRVSVVGGDEVRRQPRVRISANQSAGLRNGPSNLIDLAWRWFQRRQPCEVTWIFRSADRGASQNSWKVCDFMGV